jgi:predicted CopG family antitoxin
MATTIQISDETKQLLSSLKTEERKTYDEIIKALIKKQNLTPQSMFGTHKNLRWNKEEDRLRFDDE